MVGISVCCPYLSNSLSSLTANSYGTVNAKQKNEAEAIPWLLRSVDLNPWNWGTWEELSNLISNTQEVRVHTYPLSERLKAGLQIA